MPGETVECIFIFQVIFGTVMVTNEANVLYRRKNEPFRFSLASQSVTRHYCFVFDWVSIGLQVQSSVEFALVLEYCTI